MTEGFWFLNSRRRPRLKNRCQAHDLERAAAAFIEFSQRGMGPPGLIAPIDYRHPIITTLA